jgi:hypothetical protein
MWYNIFFTIESCSDVFILQMGIALVHLDAGMASGHHRDINMDLLARPAR